MSDVAIRVENLGKLYHIGGPQDRYKTIRDSIMDGVKAPFKRAGNLLRGQAHGAAQLDQTIWALKDVSFEVKQGEVVGIIGRNGAGKSTLLKILSRITEPTVGEIMLRGRVGSLLEVGTGFHPELTGRENVFLNGSILGMKREEIDRKFDEIVDFSEIEKFIDTPVKHYSSGMYVRLAFAVAAHLEPEILLVDEVLAVGDASFQRKCLGMMGDVAKGGRTILFVSHNMAAIRKLCSQSIWVDLGELRQKGTTSQIVDNYLRDSDHSKASAESIFTEDISREFQLLSFRVMNQDGFVTQQFECDEPITLSMICQVNQSVPGLFGYLTISRLDGTVVMVSDSFDSGNNSLDELPIGKHAVQIMVPARTLAPGEYTVYLNFTSSFGLKGFHIDSPGIVGSFTLDDHTTQRGNRRLGFFSTRLDWDIEMLNSQYSSENTQFGKDQVGR